jgi:hypothetical protein
MPRKPKGLILERQEVSQVFDTKSLFKKELSMQAKKEFARKIIDEITLRSMSGFDRSGNKFQKYTKKYAKWKGVPRNKVDMVLYDEMLKSQKAQVGNFDEGDLKIRIEKGFNTDKAHGHMTGMEGKGTKREFFGVKKADLVKIVKAIKQEFPEKEKINLKDFKQAAEKAKGDNITITQSRKDVKKEILDIFESL